MRCSSSPVGLEDSERCFERSHAFSGDCVASLWYSGGRQSESVIAQSARSTQDKTVRRKAQAAIQLRPVSRLDLGNSGIDLRRGWGNWRGDHG